MNKNTILNSVKEAEKNIDKVNKDNYRQCFHLMPPVGWLNDPNGLCQINGEYNVFFQYSPLSPKGSGGRFWGWYKSRDLINWKYEGVPLVTDTQWDKDGVYSGSALVEDNKIHIFYTGNVKHKGEYDYINAGRESNTIYTTPENWEKQLIFTNSDYPESYTQHIRDPKVWKENDKYYMVLGGRKKGDKGAVLLYTSDNISSGWHFLREITTEKKFGYMWECPDIFKLDNQYFLSLSPQGLEQEGYKYQNIYQSGYFSIDGDYRSDCDLINFTEWDMGFDFYAPQTFKDELNRRILIGWVGMPDAEYTNPTVERGWQNCLTVPRVLEYKKGKIYQTPVPEINKLRRDAAALNSGDKVSLKICDIIIENINSNNFKADIKGVLSIEYSNNLFKITLDQYGRKERGLVLSSLDKVRILADSSVAEIYINDGEYVFTTMYYSEDDFISINCPDSRITLWSMDKMEVRY